MAHTNDMVAHIWAQGRQESARSHNGQFYCEGRALYSYGPHFVVGYIMPDGTTLITSDRYSLSTGRHISLARNALRVPAIMVPDLTKLVNAFEWLESGDKDLATQRIIHVLQNHVLTMSEDSARYLLGLVGRTRSYDKILREAERARDREEKERTKRETASRLAAAKAFDAMSDVEFMAALADVENKREYIHRHPHRRDLGIYKTPSELVGDYIRRVNQFHKAAKVQRTPALARRIEARLEVLRDRRAQLQKREDLHTKLREYRRNKNTLREKLARRESLTRLECRILAKQALFFADYPSKLISQAARLTLQRIAAECDTLEKLAAEKENRERFERDQETRAAWLAGGRLGRWFNDAHGGVMLRAVDVERDETGRITGGTLETSNGAECPLTHALRAFDMVRKLVAEGKDWKANGQTIRVGHFHIDSISRHGTLTAGCHRINYAEMVRLAEELGL